MIAFLQHDWRMLVLELSPLPGKPGYFDASVVNTLAKNKAEPTKKSRRGLATAPTRQRADEFMLWLNKNPGSYPLYEAMNSALGNVAPGTAQAVAKEIARRRLAKVNIKIRPHTIASLDKI